jgi:hypothetical protein
MHLSGIPRGTPGCGHWDRAHVAVTGSYQVPFEDISRPASVGGGLQAACSLLAALLLGPTGIAFVRAGVFRGWAVPVLVVGMLATFFLTPVSWLPAVAWFLVARAVWRGGRRLGAGPAPQ